MTKKTTTLDSLETVSYVYTKQQIRTRIWVKNSEGNRWDIRWLCAQRLKDEKGEKHSWLVGWPIFLERLVSLKEIKGCERGTHAAYTTWPERDREENWDRRKVGREKWTFPLCRWSTFRVESNDILHSSAEKRFHELDKYTLKQSERRRRIKVIPRVSGKRAQHIQSMRTTQVRNSIYRIDTLTDTPWTFAGFAFRPIFDGRILRERRLKQFQLDEVRASG